MNSLIQLFDRLHPTMQWGVILRNESFGDFVSIEHHRMHLHKLRCYRTIYSGDMVCV